MDKKTKKKIITDFKTHEGDTGSPEVQVAILSQQMEDVSGHLKAHPGDVHSRRGLLKIVSKRRRLFSYLMQKEAKRYKALISRLGLSK